jgi:Zn finger protein HypA/HybF involved in hydrogenase expression
MDKNFVIKCVRCAWSEAVTGISSDMTHLYEIKSACPTCGGARKFRCPKCGNLSKMKRIRGNTEPKKPGK